MWFLKRRDPRIGDELRFHRDQLIEEYTAAGMDRREAERRVFLEFGNVPQIEEAVRDVRGRWIEDVVSDVQYAVRALRKSPGFAAVAVLSFALGIGANIAIFTLINAVMLRTLPVPQPDRLVQLTRIRPEDGRAAFISYPLFEQIHDRVTSVSGAFAQSTLQVTIAVDGEEEFVTSDLVSGDYARVLELEPAAGRLLEPPDDVDSPASPAAVITDTYWQRRFGRSPEAIGKSITVRDRIFTIVGVTPPQWRGARAGFPPDILLPLRTMMLDSQRRTDDNNWLSPLARLKAGATLEQANAELQVLYAPFVQAQASREAEKDRPNILRQRAAALSAPDGFNPIRDNIAQPLLVVMGIVGLILLLACVNLSGLLLARATARQREISIRLAMGAGTGRLVRQLLTESMVLAAAGGAVGLAVAGWFSASLFGLFVTGRDVALSVAPDARVLLFASAISVVACVAAGLVPAMRSVRVSVNPTLKEVRAHGHQRLGKALVVAQLAISMVLVVGATLFVGTLVKLYGVDRGFDSDGLLVVSLRTARPYPAARVRATQTAVLDRLKQVPGVRSASATFVVPVSGSLWGRRVRVEGYAFRPDEPEIVGFHAVAPDYFATLGTPLVAGREFDARDTESAPRVAIVNDSFARRFFGTASPLGRRVSSVNATYQIVGVVRDAKYQSLRDAAIDTLYMPWLQREEVQPTSFNYLLRAVAGDPIRLAPLVERSLRDVDPALHVRTARRYEEIVDQTIATERMLAMLGGFFGVLALVVAALGMFGLLAFQVARRTNELGVRMALGASRQAITGLVVRDVLLMIVTGVSIGAAAALVLTGLARKILFGLTPTDPAVFGVAATVLATAALVAGWLPARRASRVDPVVALRHE